MTGQKGKGHTACLLSLAENCLHLLLTDCVSMKQVDLEEALDLSSGG